MVTSTTTGWPPRRLPSRTRLLRIRLARWRAAVTRPAPRQAGRSGRIGRAARFVLLLVQRLALWTAWAGVTAAVFIAVDLYS
jgi:hypothetical protein